MQHGSMRGANVPGADERSPAWIKWVPGYEPARTVFWLALASLTPTMLFLFIGAIQFPGGAWHFTDWAMHRSWRHALSGSDTT